MSRNQYALWIPSKGQFLNLDEEPLLLDSAEDWEEIRPTIVSDTEIVLVDSFTNQPVS